MAVQVDGHTGELVGARRTGGHVLPLDDTQRREPLGRPHQGG
jgi:hypothetical protein